MTQTLDFAPSSLDLLGLRANDDSAFLVTVTLGGDPLDLTDAVIGAQAREFATTDDPPALVAGITIEDAVGGEFTVRWSGADIAALLDGDEKWLGSWDCAIQLPTSPSPVTILAGRIRCESDVTREAP